MKKLRLFFRRLFFGSQRYDASTWVDSRNRNFKIDSLLPRGATPISQLWHTEGVLDQGRHAACTGFAVCGDAWSDPIRVAGITNQLAVILYKEAQKVDEWPGENYEGSSVNAAMKVATSWGWYSEYRWAFGVDDVVLALGYIGPVILSINWYADMEKPVDGYVRPTGALVGRHAILCRGYNAETREFTLRNSWGPSWGTQGDSLLRYDDLKRLLNEEGHACVPTLRSTSEG